MAPRITLTFDNGQTPGDTDRVLEIPAVHGIRSTFFVIGEKVVAGSDARLCLSGRIARAIGSAITRSRTAD